jgi:hypothetical protein
MQITFAPFALILALYLPAKVGQTNSEQPQIANRGTPAIPFVVDVVKPRLNEQETKALGVHRFQYRRDSCQDAETRIGNCLFYGRMASCYPAL